MVKPRKAIRIPLSKLSARQRKQLAGNGTRNLNRVYTVIPKGVSKKTLQYARYSTPATIDGRRITLTGRERRRQLVESPKLLSLKGPAEFIYPKGTKTKRKK